MAGEQSGAEQEIQVVLCTCPPDDAGRIAGDLVAERLVACVNVIPRVVSTYRWEGQVARDDEALLVIKTAAARVAALTDRIREIHPYELPEVIAVPVTGGLSAYIAWVGNESRAGS